MSNSIRLQTVICVKRRLATDRFRGMLLYRLGYPPPDLRSGRTRMSNMSANLDGHTIEIVEADGKYVCMVPSLFLTASHSDLAKAYDEIRLKRNRLIQEAVEAGVGDRLFSHADRPLRPASASTGVLAQFAIRTSIVTVAAALLVILSGFVASAISRKAADVLVSRLESYSPVNRDWNKEATAVQEWLFEEAAPRNQPTPLQEEKIRESLRILVSRIRPYLQELAPLTQLQPTPVTPVQPATGKN
jgi:hypothetical protein